MAIGGITSNGSTGSVAGNSAFSDLSSADFIKIITQELTQQDPFSPNDSGALLEQISSLRNVESQLSLQKTLESLVSQNSFAAASQTIGKIVAGLDADNIEQIGMVMSVRLENGKAILELDTGKRLSFDRLTEIANAATPAA